MMARTQLWKLQKQGELVQPFKKGAFHPSHKGSFLPQQTL